MPDERMTLEGMAATRVSYPLFTMYLRDGRSDEWPIYNRTEATALFRALATVGGIATSNPNPPPPITYEEEPKDDLTAEEVEPVERSRSGFAPKIGDVVEVLEAIPLGAPGVRVVVTEVHPDKPNTFRLRTEDGRLESKDWWPLGKIQPLGP